MVSVSTLEEVLRSGLPGPSREYTEVLFSRKEFLVHIKE